MSDLGVTRRDSVITPTPPSSPQGVIRRTPQHTPALAGVPPGEHQARRQPSPGLEDEEDDSSDSVFTSKNTNMATKDALFLGFQNAKIEAEVILDLIEIEDTMSESGIIFEQNRLNRVSAACVNMGKFLRKIEDLPNSGITADDLDDLKAEHRYVEISFQKCQAELDQAQAAWPLTEARAWFSYVLRWASANGVTALKDESVEVYDIGKPALPAVPPDQEINTKDLCRKLPSDVALDTIASNIPGMPSVMEVEAADDERFPSVDTHTPIPGDDVSIEKLEYTALTYKRNTPEIVEDTGDWEIFCLEHCLQPERKSSAIMYNINPCSSSDILVTMTKESISYGPWNCFKMMGEEILLGEPPPWARRNFEPVFDHITNFVMSASCCMVTSIESLAFLPMWKTPRPYNLVPTSTLCLLASTSLFTMEPTATSYLASLAIWRPPWYELPEEECSNNSCISVYDSVLPGREKDPLWPPSLLDTAATVLDMSYKYLDHWWLNMDKAAMWSITNLSKLDISVSGKKIISSQSAATKHTSPGQIHRLADKSLIQLNFQVWQPPWPSLLSDTKRRSSSTKLPPGSISLFSGLRSATSCLLDPVESPRLPNLCNTATTRSCMPRCSLSIVRDFSFAPCLPVDAKTLVDGARGLSSSFVTAQEL